MSEESVGLTRVDTHNFLASLARERPLFHSEADFQHALAWRIHRSLPEAQIRLELPVTGEARRYLDLSVQHGGEQILIELKYKTHALHTTVDGEAYLLRNQGAQDIGRYDFLKDLERLEGLVREGVGRRGVAILLSNDHGYWQAARSHTVDAAFRLHEGSLLKGLRHWDANAASGTKRSREAPIQLRGNYRNRWRDYSRVAEGAGGQFRYLLHEVRA